MRPIRAGQVAATTSVLLLALVVGVTTGLGASAGSSDFKLTIGDIEAYTGDLGSLGAPADKAVKLWNTGHGANGLVATLRGRVGRARLRALHPNPWLSRAERWISHQSAQRSILRGIPLS